MLEKTKKVVAAVGSEIDRKVKVLMTIDMEWRGSHIGRAQGETSRHCNTNLFRETWYIP